MLLCRGRDKLCVCVWERERDTHTHTHTHTRQRIENTQEEVYINKGDESTYYKVGEGALYSQPLSSLTTRHMSHAECGSS